jgi:hypothetical protein
MDDWCKDFIRERGFDFAWIQVIAKMGLEKQDKVMLYTRGRDPNAFQSYCFGFTEYVRTGHASRRTER